MLAADLIVAGNNLRICGKKNGRKLFQKK